MEVGDIGGWDCIGVGWEGLESGYGCFKSLSSGDVSLRFFFAGGRQKEGREGKRKKKRKDLYGRNERLSYGGGMAGVVIDFLLRASAIFILHHFPW